MACFNSKYDSDDIYDNDDDDEISKQFDK